jgi:Tripartite tricarboxylate transporter TctB family
VSTSVQPRWSDCLPPLVLFLLSLGFVVVGFSYNAASRSVPELIGGAMLVLTALDVASRSPTTLGRVLVRWLNPAGLSEGHETSPGLRRRQAMAMAGMVGFGAAMVWLGVLVSVPVFALAAIWLGGRRGVVFSVVVAAATTLLIWALFTPLLGLALWPGILFGGDW